MLLAQAPATAPVALAHANEFGFSYSLPTDWDVKDFGPAVPLLQQQLEKRADSEGEKKAASCVQVPLLATHGTPRSVIEIVTLGYECFGKQFADTDLPAFAMGVAGGLKKTFIIADPIYGAYTLGTHSVWIERANGTSIAHPELKFTTETVCTLLSKAAVCWAAIASDDTALQIFEHGAVTFEGEAPVALVPATAFNKKP
jgi:hypothetical protein